ncbi:Hypothetical protein SMAX5B_011174 [Scophthalmus maximus]|uniref:Uncharacterized protein n=1 Tax=Scophthalmus maximus TaxID=52904 RepID=A0A2U9CTP1_SCOMX|nr:Hypothetical protein SMAX5B_011174 [Scophthalmus maximus]
MDNAILSSGGTHGSGGLCNPPGCGSVSRGIVGRRRIREGGEGAGDHPAPLSCGSTMTSDPSHTSSPHRTCSRIWNFSSKARDSTRRRRTDSGSQDAAFALGSLVCTRILTREDKPVQSYCRWLHGERERCVPVPSELCPTQSAVPP